MYGFEHKRTEGQFEIAWNELQAASPQAGDGGFLLGVSGSKLVVDDIPIETGQAERTFAQLLTTARLASIDFSTKVTVTDFARLVRAFGRRGSWTCGGSWWQSCPNCSPRGWPPEGEGAPQADWEGYTVWTGGKR